jgi:hypothetical protein
MVWFGFGNGTIEWIKLCKIVWCFVSFFNSNYHYLIIAQLSINNRKITTKTVTQHNNNHTQYLVSWHRVSLCWLWCFHSYAVCHYAECRPSLSLCYVSLCWVSWRNKPLLGPVPRNFLFLPYRNKLRCLPMSVTSTLVYVWGQVWKPSIRVKSC